MAVRPIVLYKTNEAELRQMSEPVPDGSNRTKKIISDLKDTLVHHGNGVGLAGPQIGIHQRVIVVCFGAGNEKKARLPIGIINPVIIEEGRELPDFDGCLSLPGLYAETVRPHFMRLQGLDECGQSFEWTLEGFDSVVVHHEVDHLNGVLFVDRVASSDKFYTATRAQ
jgi:peptide deformylase